MRACHGAACFALTLVERLLKALGLEFTTATRAAFLIQATALLTPLLASLSGDRPGRAVWCALLCSLPRARVPIQATALLTPLQASLSSD